MTRTALTGRRTPGSPAHGRPNETVENVTALDDRLDVASMTREQRQAAQGEILRQHPELADEFRRMTGVESSQRHHRIQRGRKRVAFPAPVARIPAPGFESTGPFGKAGGFARATLSTALSRPRFRLL
jgi:hypothetical protein